MLRSTFLKWTGAALAAGGILEALLNLILTPRMASEAPFEQVAASGVFLWRQSLSALAVMLLLFGCIGLYLAQEGRNRQFGAFAFVIAFVGSTLVVAWEWVDIFVLRMLAIRTPGALRALEDAEGVNLYDIGAIVPISLFALGWLALAAWSWRVTPALRTPSALVVVGIFAIPFLSAALGPGWGGAVGNVILGSGLCLLGLGVRKLADDLSKADALGV